jgi:hypothetical protein
MSEKNKDKKSTWALLVSIVALLLCLLLLMLWVFEVMPHSVITPDSFIGACVSLLAVIVTIAIGWQIFNIVEVKSIIKEYAQKQVEVDKLQNQLQKQIHKIETDAEYDLHHSMHLHAITLALHCQKQKKYSEACYHCFEALAESVQMRELMNVDNIFEMLHVNMKAVVTQIKLSELDKHELKGMENIIRASKHYHLFADRFENAIVEFYQKTLEKS